MIVNLKSQRQTIAASLNDTISTTVVKICCRTLIFRADWMVSIDICAEGFDAPRIRVVAYLTTVVTRSRFLQGITRPVRMTPDLAASEPVPRHSSFVFAPADGLRPQLVTG